MFKLSFFFTLCIGLALVYTSVAQQIPFWGYNCVDSQCVRVQANITDPDTLLGLHACFLSCNEFGTLWPRPRNVVSWSNTLLNLNRTNVQLRRAVPEEHAEFWEQSIDRFIGIIDARVGDEEVVDGEFGLAIEIDVESDSLELSLDTNEQYELELSSNDNDELVARISALTYYGARHGLETLSQLIAFDEFTSQLKILSAASIRDEPSYRHRGILLDTSRRFYPVDVIKRTLDVMAMTKLNVFHWHITDSQSFAMVLLSHPELSQKGAYSPRKVYRPSDIREIVEYGRVRGVRIIPEFDAPSHVAEGFQNTNLVTCMHAQPWGQFCAGPPCGQFDVTKPEVYELLYELYSEMNEMFDYPPQFHLGGDEVFSSCWNSSSEVRDFMIERGWGLTENDFLKLWGYFQERALNVYRYVTDYDEVKKPILWTSSLTEEDVIDEYLNPDDYIIQIWTTAHGSDSQISHLLEKGYDVIISNHDVLYLDCGFGNWVGSGNNWCSPFSPWHLIYDNNFRDMAGDRTSQVLGGEVCSWSEPTDDVTLDSKLWPRASAFGERLWSDPDTDFRGAEYRILIHREFLVQYGIHAESIQPEWCVQNLGECPYNS
ncbi:chitooligosaccharidolytic beta-N-acetylglucosaminidase-like [Bradysia coprophila]|uniref:chitooligosaccharidolytic beta-N-acetylglucosaminidase-like n=1 Tax=Bradysia coprophila TaxID=38358 RepID=UPI00187DA6B9|nr:chitooligosaccharidolytic beta-N-acetylglucosaminidase-like [Bradysia coprophila]